MALEMNMYRLKNKVRAVQIDKDWYRYLMVDRKLTDARVGSWYIIGIDGTEYIWDDKRFFSLFEPVP